MHAIMYTCDGEVLYYMYVHINCGYNIIKRHSLYTIIWHVLYYISLHYYGIMLLQYKYISYYIQIIVLSYTIIIMTLACMPLNNVVH